MDKKGLIGLDVSLCNTGYVILDNNLNLIEHGLIKVPRMSGKPFGDRLYYLWQEIVRIFTSKIPNNDIVVEVSYDTGFRGRNQHISHYFAACAIISCFFRDNIVAFSNAELFEYSPQQTRRVAGKSNASKSQVEFFVKHFFSNINIEKFSEHEIDALATIACHLQARKR